MESTPHLTTEEIAEERRRIEIAQTIVEDNTGPIIRLLEYTRKNPEAALALAFASGLLIGLIARRD